MECRLWRVTLAVLTVDDVSVLGGEGEEGGNVSDFSSGNFKTQDKKRPCTNIMLRFSE